MMAREVRYHTGFLSDSHTRIGLSADDDPRIVVSEPLP